MALKCGIVGLPNAGKSSLLAAITNAMPKIANYKFTTLNPNLGVATYDDKEITLADIPGLVEGAHEGVGLGIQFLKHIERCKTLMHLLDITNQDLENTYKQVRTELGSYSKDLLNKKELIVLNKTDLLEKEEVSQILKEFSFFALEAYWTSALFQTPSLLNLLPYLCQLAEQKKFD